MSSKMNKEDKMKNYFDLTGQTAVVTGASTGLGVQMAKAFASQGANLVLIARIWCIGSSVYMRHYGYRESKSSSGSHYGKIRTGRYISQ